MSEAVAVKQRGKQRDPAKEQLFRALIAEQRASGQSVKTFCESKGVKATTFQSWIQTIARRDAAGTASQPTSPAGKKRGRKPGVKMVLPAPTSNGHAGHNKPYGPGSKAFEEWQAQQQPKSENKAASTILGGMTYMRADQSGDGASAPLVTGIAMTVYSGTTPTLVRIPPGTGRGDIENLLGVLGVLPAPK